MAKNLNDVLATYARDVFRKQADCDYISARANYRMRLRQQFLWSAQQAIEKYLKAILLFNGKSARYYPSGTKQKEFKHNLEALYGEVEKIPLLGFALEPEEQEFLAYLSAQGGANRYLSTSAYNSGEVIHRLDRLVWSIRRYCQCFPDRHFGSKAPVPGLKESFIRSISDPSVKKPPHTFSFFAGEGGELEDVLKRDSRDVARRALVWANLYYGKKRRLRVTYDSFASTEGPPHERGWTGVDWEEVKKYVQLPPSV